MSDDTDTTEHATMFAETPTELIPKMDEFPVSNTAYYQQLVLTDPATVSWGDQVNGRNLARAYYSQFDGEPLGTFRQVNETDWEQRNIEGTSVFSFVEQGRDDWSVLLHDASRGVNIHLDMHRKMVKYSDPNTETVDLYPILSGDTGDNRELTEEVDPFAWNNDLPDTAATGVLLTFEQGWYQKGLALGELRKSVCLAPGEVTKLAVVDWRRDTTSRETSTTAQREQVSATVDDTMSAVKVQNAVQSEAARGVSVSMGRASQTQGSVGGSIGFVSGSVSGGTSTRAGMSATSSTGQRSVAASATKDIERRTEQLAQSQRSARATQIRDASETEQESTSTRVVANYNHAHAMTMQYFEVLQIYRLETRVARAERCVFIPMVPLEFTPASLQAADDTTIELLREVLQALGAHQLDEMVAAIHRKAPSIADSIKDHVDRLAEARQRLAGIDAQERALRQQLDVHRNASNLWSFPFMTFHFEIAIAAIGAPRGSVQQEIRSLETALEQKRLAQQEQGRLFGLLDQHRVMLNQQMWMRIDDHTWHRNLANRTYPNAPYRGQPIGGLVDPTPVGYFGTYMAFKWDFPREAIGDDDSLALIDADEFEAMYLDNGASTQTQIVLPSEGVFAEAVLGQANSAEKIDITRFWNWQDSPIPILPPEMATVNTGSRARDVELPGRLDLGPSIAMLRDAGLLPDIDNDAILKALQISVAGDHLALVEAAQQAGAESGAAASEGAGQSSTQTVAGIGNMQDMVVGLANSAVVETITGAISGGATESPSGVGGLLNAARGAVSGGANSGGAKKTTTKKIATKKSTTKKTAPKKPAAKKPATGTKSGSGGTKKATGAAKPSKRTSVKTRTRRP